MTINTEPALQLLYEFRALLGRNQEIHSQHGDGAANGDESANRLTELEPLIEDIAAEVESDTDRHSAPDHLILAADMWWWSNRVTWVARLIGIIENTARREAIFSPPGPRLVATQLHPWVWNAATDLWDDGHYREAVQKAATAIEQQTQLKLGLDNLNAANLYMTAFKADSKPGNRRLRLRELDEETTDRQTTADWRSAHDGAAHFGRGCTQAIRNLTTHRTDDLEEQVALEYLAALSVLARWVDTAEPLTV